MHRVGAYSAWLHLANMRWDPIIHATELPLISHFAHTVWHNLLKFILTSILWFMESNVTQSIACKPADPVELVHALSNPCTAGESMRICMQWLSNLLLVVGWLQHILPHLQQAERCSRSGATWILHCDTPISSWPVMGPHPARQKTVVLCKLHTHSTRIFFCDHSDSQSNATAYQTCAT